MLPSRMREFIGFDADMLLTPTTLQQNLARACSLLTPLPSSQHSADGDALPKAEADRSGCWSTRLVLAKIDRSSSRLDRYCSRGAGWGWCGCGWQVVRTGSSGRGRRGGRQRRCAGRRRRCRRRRWQDAVRGADGRALRLEHGAVGCRHVGDDPSLRYEHAAGETLHSSSSSER